MFKLSLSLQRAKDSIEYDVLAEGEKAAQDKADVENTIQNDNILREEKKLISFIENLANSVKSKEEAFASVSKFISEYLNIPAVYIAIKKPVGDSEVLHYFSASPGQEFMVGKKLIKPAEAEGDEAPTRQGLSFEAFKLPEVPEEEPGFFYCFCHLSLLPLTLFLSPLFFPPLFFPLSHS